MRKCDRRWWYGVMRPRDAGGVCTGEPGAVTSTTCCHLGVRSGGNTVYLPGRSIIFSKKDAYPLDPAIYEAFDAAKTVVRDRSERRCSRWI